MKGLLIATILILSSLVPLTTVAENEPVFEKGYLYHDKVIRHAKVVINKK